jgi:hypothetical protein
VKRPRAFVGVQYGRHERRTTRLHVPHQQHGGFACRCVGGGVDVTRGGEATQGGEDLEQGVRRYGDEADDEGQQVPVSAAC